MVECPFPGQRRRNLAAPADAIQNRHSDCYKFITFTPELQAYSPEIGPAAQFKKVKTFFEKTLDIWGNGWYYNTRSAPVAQLDRVSDYESEGREFESLPAHQVKSYIQSNLDVAFNFLFYIVSASCCSRHGAFFYVCTDSHNISGYY